jgi:DNA polymerase
MGQTQESGKKGRYSKVSRSGYMVNKQDINRLSEDEYLGLIEDVENHIKYLGQIGLDGFDASKDNLEKVRLWGIDKPLLPDTLDAIRRELKECCRCNLKENRKNIIFGKGNPDARIMFIGGWPALAEDIMDDPYAGDAGKLFVNIIQSLKQTIETVYYSNIIKCRPLADAEPLADEIRECLPFIRRQIDVIKPEVICTLGGFATQTLLDTDEPLERLRGRFHDYNGIKVIPTYHPSELVINAEKKRPVWEDMKKIMGIT